ncbi:MAG TPA: MGMT family protein, partial [Hydrogenophaga sp.]
QGREQPGRRQFPRLFFEYDEPIGRVRSHRALAVFRGRALEILNVKLGRNPFAPVVPCHRVLAAGHRAGGFSAQGGAATKLRMLAIEGVGLGGTRPLFDSL